MPDSGLSRSSLQGQLATLAGGSKLTGPGIRGASHGTHSMLSGPPTALEQAQDRRPESAVEAEGDLGDSGSSVACGSPPGVGALQSRHRQQAAGVQPGSAEGPRCLPRIDHGFTDHRDAAENATARSVRDH